MRFDSGAIHRSAGVGVRIVGLCKLIVIVDIIKPAVSFIAGLANGTQSIGFNKNRIDPVPFNSAAIYRDMGIVGLERPRLKLCLI